MRWRVAVPIGAAQEQVGLLHTPAANHTVRLRPLWIAPWAATVVVLVVKVQYLFPDVARHIVGIVDGIVQWPRSVGTVADH